jgi:hypothetical protein
MTMGYAEFEEKVCEPVYKKVTRSAGGSVERDKLPYWIERNDISRRKGPGTRDYIRDYIIANHPAAVADVSKRQQARAERRMHVRAEHAWWSVPKNRAQSRKVLREQYGLKGKGYRFTWSDRKGSVMVHGPNFRRPMTLRQYEQRFHRTK